MEIKIMGNVPDSFKRKPSILEVIRAYNQEYTDKTGKQPPYTEQVAYCYVVLSLAMDIIKTLPAKEGGKNE